MKRNNLQGLNPIKKDNQDIHLGYITTLPALSELSGVFSLGNTPIRNQEADQNSDFCAAYGTVGMAYLMDGIEGSPEWVFAASKEISGDNEEFGQDMRSIFKAWVKYGSPRKENVKVPENLSDRRYLKNYDLNLSGEELKKKTFVTCKGKYDAFDNIRASIWKFRDERRAVGIGVVFAWSLSDVYLDTVMDGGFGHFMFATGWDKDYLEVFNSYGIEAGKEGKHYIHRSVINFFIEKFGANMMIDMPVEEARVKQIEYIKKKEQKQNWLQEILKNLWDFFLDILIPDRLRTLGAQRSPQWGTVRRAFLLKYPECAVCRKKGTLLSPNNVHHKKLFNRSPDLELDFQNLLTLCREDHFIFGHLKRWSCQNDSIEEDAKIWYNKIKSRL